tara:strand:- start:524 stop:1084 length:561 start_codon:yes stop_codon:yes gene_type:complete
MAAVLENIEKETKIKMEQALYIKLATHPLGDLERYKGWDKIEEIKDRIEIFEGLTNKQAMSINPISDRLLKKRGLEALKILEKEYELALEQYNKNLNKKASSSDRNRRKKMKQRIRKKTMKRMLKGTEPEGGWDTIGELEGIDKKVSSNWGGKKHKKRKTKKRKHTKKTKKRKSRKSKRRKSRKRN